MKKLIILSCTFFVFACSSYKDVRPGLEGIHKVSILGEDIKDTESNAYKQANAYCRDQKKKAEFLSEETFKATPNEVDVDTKMFKKSESVATDVSFRCI
jgi:hypothetical protein